MDGRVTSLGLKKGAWTADEDSLLRKCIERYGEGKWHQVPLRAGLNRCRKSCRLRWLNYLKPSIKRGAFGDDEIDLILRLHKLLGNRWSLIAGRLPGRTANDVKNYWNTHLNKKAEPSTKIKTIKEKVTFPVINPAKKVDVIRPRPRSFSNNNSCYPLKGHLEIKFQSNDVVSNNKNNNDDDDDKYKCSTPTNQSAETAWWENLFEESEESKAKKVVAETAQTTWMESAMSTFEDDLWNLLN